MSPSRSLHPSVQQVILRRAETRNDLGRGDLAEIMERGFNDLLAALLAISEQLDWVNTHLENLEDRDSGA